MHPYTIQVIIRYIPVIGNGDRHFTSRTNKMNHWRRYACHHCDGFRPLAPRHSRAIILCNPVTHFTLYQWMFRVRLEALAVNNPHITDPNILYPGDVLCVPGLIAYPCCIMMSSRARVPFGTSGTALITFAPQGGQAVLLSATLPQPQWFGYFDTYLGEIALPGIGTFGNQLFPTPLELPTWSTRIDLPTVASVSLGSRVTIIPYSMLAGTSGPVVLDGLITASNCCC